MLISNFPTFSYVTWQGLIITGTDGIPNVINDGNTNCKYIYWETSDPLRLKATDEKLSTSVNRFLIYINDNGIATEVPQSENTIIIQYRDAGGGGASNGTVKRIQGQVNELDGKYYAIQEDVDGLKKLIGDSTEIDGGIVDRLNKLEQTAEGTKETISQIQTTYTEDKESQKIRDNITSSLIAMVINLSKYQNEVSNACEDFEIFDQELTAIKNAQSDFMAKVEEVFKYHDDLIVKIDTPENASIIRDLNLARTNLNTSIENLNSNINTSISDFTVVPSEVTTMLNMFGIVGVRAEEYKNTLSEAVILGVGGEVITNTLEINKTATSFSQSMSEIVEEINGETGLKQQIAKNTTNIEQTATDIKLNYMKYDTVTSEITVSDNLIKLDAGKVLLTGTLTWDSLDDSAKENLKGKDGNAEYIMLTGDQFIKYDSNGNPSRDSISISALIAGMSTSPDIVWSYKQENSYTWVDIASNNNMMYFDLRADSYIWGGMDTITIKATANDMYYDEITIVKIKDGSLAEYVELIGQQAFKYTIEKGETDFTIIPEVITLEGIEHNIGTTNTHWYYKLPGQTEWTRMIENDNKFVISVFPDDPILFANNDVVQIKFELNTHSDVITIAKLYDAKSNAMAILSNETHIIPCQSDGTPISLDGATTTMSIYVGSINDTDNWSITITPSNGVTGVASNNNKTYTITGLSSDTGYVDFIARKDDFDSVTKRFTITKSRSGQDGDAGTSYWLTSSASIIVKKEDETLDPSIILLNAKCKQGEEGVTDYKGRFTISELVNDQWGIKYTSSVAENSCAYSISNNPTAIKIELYSEDNILLDEENIPIVLDGTVTPVAFLDNDAHTIPCNSNGNPLNYEGASTRMYVFVGSIDDSSNWTYSVSEVGVVGTLRGGAYEVSEIINNNAYVDITASKNGYEDLTRRFTITKAIYGKDGSNAKYVYITGEQVFKYADSFEGTPIPSSITLHATRYNITSSGRWQYKNGNQYINMNITSDNITITPTSGLLGTQNTCTFRFIAETYSDEITIIKVTDGQDGLPGNDGIYVLITNESHTVPCDNEGRYTAEELAKATTEVHIYRGLEEISGNVTLVTNGCQATYNRATKIVTVTQLTENTATITINVDVEGQIFSKVMTITKSLQGNPGADGNGINIIGKLPSVGDLPNDGEPGDAYLIDGLLYLWSETDGSWTDGVPIQGEKGLPGEPGTDGRTTYFHIKYSNDGKTFTANNGETLGNWLGQYTDFYEQDSNVFSDYKWKKIKGEDGEHGIVASLSNDTHTIPCLDDGTGCIFTGCSSKISLFLGAQQLTNGVSYSYSVSQNVGGRWDSTTGTYTVTTMNNVDNGYVDLTATYNGIGYTKRFTITKSKQGGDSYTINLSNDNHSFVANSDGIIEYIQSTTIEVTAYKGNVKQNVTIGGLPSVNGLTLTTSSDGIITIRTNNSLQLASSGTIDIPITVNNRSFTKTFTYTRVDCGKDGENGYTIYLTNELHSFYCESNGTISEQQSVVTTVKAFHGTTEKTPTIGNINVPNGLSITKSGATLTITANTGTSLAENGALNIPISIDGRNFVKVFSWVKTKKGQDGINAKYVVVSGEQVFKYPNGSVNPTPSSIILSATKFNISANGRWQYKNASGTYVNLGSTSVTVEITPTSGLLNSKNSCTFRYLADGCYDEITIVKVKDGIDGNSYYTWIKYASDANGKNMSDSPSGKTYIGFAYNKTSATESTNPADYTWSLIKGTDGVPGPTGPSGKTYYTWIKYSNNANGSSMYDTPNANTQYIGIAVNKTSATESTNAADYTWSKFKGDAGVAGKDGANGKDAYTIVLTNECHSFVAENNGNIPTALSTTCRVLAYKGTKEVTPTIGTITNPKGMTITKSGTTLTIRANVGTSLATSGTVNIPITIDGITFSKTFSWVKVLKGKDVSADEDLPNWITEWGNNVTTINNNTVLTPKLFAGTVSSGKPTGVAMGKDVFGTTYPVNGIVGYKNGVKTYEFNSNGNILIGSTSGQYISWDGSNLTMNVNSLKISSSSVATQNDVNNIQVGGRNLLLDTSTSKTMTGNNTTNQCVGIYDFTPSKSDLNNQKLTLSFTYTVSNYKSGYFRIQAYSTVWNSWSSITPTGNGTFTFKGTITTASNFSSNVGVQIRMDNFNGKIVISKMKLEKGNKATDWTPAPEDVDKKINTTNSTVATLQQSVNSISSTVSKNTSSLNTISSKVTKVEQTASGLSSTASTLTSDVKNLRSELNTAKQQINSNGSLITTVQKTVYTTGQVDTLLEKYKQGSRNYIRNGNFRGAVPEKASIFNWNFWGDGGHVYWSNQNGSYTGDGAVWWGTGSTNTAAIASSYIYSDKVPCNTNVTLSFNFHKENNVKAGRCGIYYYNSASERIGGKEWNCVEGKNEISFTTQSSYHFFRIVFIHGGSANGKNAYLIQLANVQLEKGNKATDFMPAYEDFQEQITTNKNNIGTNSNNIYTMKNDIIQTADALEFSFLEGGGDNKILNSSFRDGTRFWNYLSWNQNGGSGGSAGWYIRTPPDVWCLTNRNVLNAYAHSLKSNTGQPLGVGFDSNRIWGGTQWTLSCLLAAHRCKNVIIEILEFDSNGTRLGNYNVFTHSYPGGGGQDRKGWKKAHHTFTLKNSNCAWFIVRFFMGAWDGNSDSAYMWVAEPQVVLGHKSKLTYTTAADELYSGVTRIDQDGIRVSNSNASTTTTMNANGFYINQSGSGDVFKVDSNGVSLAQGTVLLNKNGLTVNSWNNGIMTYLDANGLNIVKNGTALLQVHSNGILLRQNKINIDQWGVTCYHDDGTHTQMNSSGLFHYQSGTGRKYHYLMYAGEYICASEETRTITIPWEFYGKDFQVITAIRRIYINDNAHVTNARFPLLSFYVECTGKNIWAPNFTVYASIRAWNRSSYGGYGTLIGDGNATEKAIMKPAIAFWVIA
jgi:predicted  nucleic acid-binding Zn-ribbon protein